MKTVSKLMVGTAALATAHFSTLSGATHYVWLDSPDPKPPYTNWATAARVIQDAVDGATSGDEIVVTNGTYAVGGRAVGADILVNRVAVDKPLRLMSVTGPQFTLIQGAKAAGGGNREGAIRCVYLAAGASLSGFTLTNGATRSEGDWEREQCGGGVWCEWTSSILTNCTLTGNSASAGGGVENGTLYDCTLTGNTAVDRGGGADESALNNCTLTGNSAASSWAHGGGAQDSTLYNCTLNGNSAGDHGGGVSGCTLYNCTLTANSAGWEGGGTYGGTLYNCIVYFNRARSGANYDWGWWGHLATFEHSCTTPLPPGPGNISADPQLASLTHLSATSPCLGAGSPAYANGVDIDGDPWASPPVIGADQPSPAIGALGLRVEAGLTDVATGYAVSFKAWITGLVSQSVWDFSDGTVLTNEPVPNHTWSAPGVYSVQLTAYNDSYPGGVTTNISVTVSEAVSYVDVACRNPVFPYSTWQTAATNIQDAIRVGTLTGHLVLVTNGVYRVERVEMGGLNRAALTNWNVVRSVNGPEVTVIEGATSGVRCAYVGDGSVLSGFTLANGNAGSGGGVFCEPSGVVTNCILTGNSAGSGGGTYGGTLYNCVLTANSAGSGGGAVGATLYNCTLTGNTAERGGAAGVCYDPWGRPVTGLSVLHSCVLTGNSAKEWGGAVYGGRLYNCTLTGNSAECGGAVTGYHRGFGDQGGGSSILFNCVLTGNWAQSGGAVANGTLYSCTLTGNWAQSGGGTYGGTLYNCTLTGNKASGEGASGGGVSGGTLYNCIVYFNTAHGVVDNYDGSTFEYSCTTPLAPGPGNIDTDPRLTTVTHLLPNSPCIGAGSAAYATMTDTDGEAWANPPCMGVDQVVPGHNSGPLRMWIQASSRSSAVGATVSFLANNRGPILSSLWDLGDGTVVTNRPWIDHAWNLPGVYTVRLTGHNDGVPLGVTTAVTVWVMDGTTVRYVSAANPTPAPPYGSWETAATNIQDAIAAGGGLVLVTNGVYRTGSVETNGLNRVVLLNGVSVRSVNGPGDTVIEGSPSWNGGMGWSAIRCAYVGPNAVLSGFTLTGGYTATWESSEEEVRMEGGGAWCETSGVLTNCVLTGNSAESGGGGARGGSLYRCTLAGNSADLGGGAVDGTLYNCTLASNSARSEGGGVDGGTLYNCTLTGNSASREGGGAREATLNNCTLTGNSARTGGGAFDSTLYNCILTDNSGEFAGGARGGKLYNCTLTGNSAEYGGAVCVESGNSSSILFSCIVYFNTARVGPNHAGAITFNHSCTTPLPSGPGNIDADPRFVNAAARDFLLRPDSPCIDSGTNFLTTDILGVARPLDGNGDGIARSDMGAYEFDPDIPFITGVVLTPTGLRLEWPATALGSTLQRTASLTNPVWQKVPGSETVTTVTAAAVNATEFFRMMKP